MEAKNRNIPFIAYEAMLEREDRQQRRMIAIIAIVIGLLVASNGFWVIRSIRCSKVEESPAYEEEQEEEEDEEIYKSKKVSEDKGTLQ